MPLTGSCLCGAIRYSVDTPINELRACNCLHCQKASGTAGSVNAAVPSSAFKLLQGTPKRYDARAESGRTLYRFFCGDCGSPLYSQRQTAPEAMMLRVGTLDESPEARVTINIWTRSARPWSYIDPATKQFPAQPDAPSPAK